MRFLPLSIYSLRPMADVTDPLASPSSRRQFIQTAGSLAALAAVPAPLRAAAETAVPPPSVRADLEAELQGQPMPQLREPFPLPPESRVGIALVGLGSYALNQIAPNIDNTRRMRLAALVSGNADKAREVGRAYGVDRSHIYSYDTFDRIAQDETVDVVYVILPPALHRPMTERAFAAGKHVLCEKPMAPTVEDCEAMIEAGRRAGRKLMIGYRAQYDPYNRRAIELVRGGDDGEGQIGKPLLISSDHGGQLNLDLPKDQWRARKELAGGGSLYDIGIYSVNGARYLLGEEPTEVVARYREGSGRPEVTVEEGVEWELAFPSGAVASSTSSYLVNANRIHVEGTEGEVSLEPATNYYNRNLFLEQDDESTEITFGNVNQFANQLDEMAAAVQEDRDPRTPGEEGLQDVRIMQAIYEAADTGRTVRI